jgi:hypothetical protein
MNIKPRSLFLIFILLLMILTAGMALTFGNYEAMLAPFLISVCILVLGVLELIKEIRSKSETPPPPAEDGDVSLTVVATAEGKKGEGRRFALALGWIGGFAFGIYILGFFLTILLFGFTYVRARGRNWLASTAFAVGLTLVLYFVFDVGFKAHLYRGLVFGG